MAPHDLHEAMASWAADRAHFEELGVILPGVHAYLPEAGRAELVAQALDAQPALFSAPVGGIPAWFTSFVDPNVMRVLFLPTKGAQILGEEKRGDWTTDTAIFPIMEHAGEVSSYGDWNNNGSVSVNIGWPTRQAYYYQTVKQYGEREIARTGLARINWVAELDRAAADVMNRFLNLSYFYGVGGMQNYGIFNDPGLPASITAGLKAYSGGTHTTWLYLGIPQATANEVYADIQALYAQLVGQAGGLIDVETPMVLCMSPIAQIALTITNSFGVSVEDLIRKNFPNLRIITAAEFAGASTTNPNGHPGGDWLMLFATQVQGQNIGTAAYNEKMRAHPVIQDMSSFKQKVSGGTWGAVIRMPLGVATMVGV